MAEFSRNRFFSSFPSGQMTFGVSTTELNRIYHGDLRMSIQHETGGEHALKVLKEKAAYAKPKNNRKRSDGKEAELEPDFVKKETKKVALDSRMLRTNIRYRKTKNIGKYKEIRCLYFIVYNLRK